MDPLPMRRAAPFEATLRGCRSLEAADGDEEAAASPRYCPAGALAEFALRMAGHERCVDTGLMLRDREYAMWQLACARAVDDPELTVLASGLFPYFDDPPHGAIAGGLSPHAMPA